MTAFAESATITRGWFHHADRILALLDHHRPKVVVELGSWLGASAIGMARSVRRWGGTVTCIDTWAGAIAHDGDAVGPPLMLQACARAVVEAGLGASVRFIAATTHEASACWRGPIDFLYVDADHRCAAVLSDLYDWVPHVRTGGVIAGDDYDHHAFPGVRQAWDTFETDLGRPLTRYQSSPPHPDGIHLVYTVV